MPKIRRKCFLRFQTWRRSGTRASRCSQRPTNRTAAQAAAAAATAATATAAEAVGAEAEAV